MLFGSAEPWPAMSKAVPWAGVVKTMGSPTWTVTPLVKSEQFGRDLSLVVVHRYDRVEFTAPCSDKYRVGGNRPRHAKAFGLQLAYRRADDADFLVAEQALVPGVRI